MRSLLAAVLMVYGSLALAVEPTATNCGAVCSVANQNCGSYAGSNQFFPPGTYSGSQNDDWGYVCGSVSCPVGYEFIDGYCVDMNQCPITGQSGPECLCPAGQSPGYKGTVGGGLTQQCIDDEPPPDSCEGKTIIGYLNGHPVCDNLEDACPAGYNPGLVNGELYCSPIIDDDPQCPGGGSYGTVGGVTGCFDPDPNIDDPDYPPNQDPNSPSWPGPDPQNPTFPNDPNWPSPQNPNYTPPAPGEFDDSRIVSRLDSLNSKASQTNSKLDGVNQKLDTANDKLGDIADKLGQGGDPLPEHSQATAETFEAVNTNFANRVSNSPIVSSFAGMKNLVSTDGASCPQFSIDFPPPIDATISTTMHCDLMDTIAPYLSAIMFAVFSFLAFRVFASS